MFKKPNKFMGFAGMNRFGAGFHDFAGSVVVHAVGGWLAFGALVALGIAALTGPQDAVAAMMAALVSSLCIWNQSSLTTVTETTSAKCRSRMYLPTS